jgi:hypothetical protein
MAGPGRRPARRPSLIVAGRGACGASWRGRRRASSGVERGCGGGGGAPGCASPAPAAARTADSPPRHPMNSTPMRDLPGARPRSRVDQAVVEPRRHALVAESALTVPGARRSAWSRREYRLGDAALGPAPLDRGLHPRSSSGSSAQARLIAGLPGGVTARLPAASALVGRERPSDPARCDSIWHSPWQIGGTEGRGPASAGLGTTCLPWSRGLRRQRKDPIRHARWRMRPCSTRNRPLRPPFAAHPPPPGAPGRSARTCSSSRTAPSLRAHHYAA